MTHLSLFTGIGGLDLAAEAAGFVTVGQCEWNEHATKVLEKNWPEVPRWRDIRTLTKESYFEKTGRTTVDVLSGGFPCQPFSVAGKRRGTADDRFLWPQMLRVAGELRPTWILGENVAGLLSMAEPDGDAYVESRTINRYPEVDYYKGVYVQPERMLIGRICEEIESLGYEVTVFCVPACGVDAPHRRDRIAIIAHANCGGSGAWGAERTRQQRETAPAEGGDDVADADGSQWREKCQERDGMEVRMDCVSERTQSADRSERGCTDVSDTPCADVEGWGDNDSPITYKRPREGQFGTKDCENASDPSCELCERIRVARGWRPEPANDGWWPVEPDVGRVAYGVPHRVDRLKELGNAAAPPQFFPFFDAIRQVEETMRRRGEHDHQA